MPKSREIEPESRDGRNVLYGFDHIRPAFKEHAGKLCDLVLLNRGCIVTVQHGNGTSEHLVPSILNRLIYLKGRLSSIDFHLASFEHSRQTHEQFEREMDSVACITANKHKVVLVLDSCGSDFFDLDNPRTGYMPYLVEKWRQRFDIVPIIPYYPRSESSRDAFVQQWQFLINGDRNKTVPIYRTPPFRFSDHVAAEIATKYVTDKKLIHVDQAMFSLFVKAVPHQLGLYTKYMKLLDSSKNIEELVRRLKMSFDPKNVRVNPIHGFLISQTELDDAYAYLDQAYPSKTGRY